MAKAPTGETEIPPRPDGTSPRIVKPQYLDTPYESPARIGNGAEDAPPFVVENGVIKTVTRFGLKPADDLPRGTSDSLIDAVQKVYAALTQQIAYHEREAKRLRESLVPFASMARQPAAEPAASGNDVIQQLLALADKLPPQNGEPIS